MLYLYRRREEMEVTVTLDFDGTLTSTYPAIRRWVDSDS